MRKIEHRQIARKLIECPGRRHGPPWRRDFMLDQALPKSADGADIVAPSWF
jgi:hypothetical protein